MSKVNKWNINIELFKKEHRKSKFSVKWLKNGLVNMMEQIYLYLQDFYQLTGFPKPQVFTTLNLYEQKWVNNKHELKRTIIDMLKWAGEHPQRITQRTTGN